MYTHLIRRCLKTYGGQSQLQNLMTRCMEQKTSNLSYMAPDNEMIFKDWYMKNDPPMWISFDSEGSSVPVHDPQQKNIVCKQTINSRV